MLATGFAIVWTCAVALSRLVIGVHWLTDVLASMALGAVIPVFFSKLFDLHQRHQMEKNDTCVRWRTVRPPQKVNDRPLDLYKEKTVRIVFAADGSKYTKKALAFLVTHESMAGPEDEIFVLRGEGWQAR